MWWWFLIGFIVAIAILWVIIPFPSSVSLPVLENLNISYNQDFIFSIENPNAVDVNVILKFSQFDQDIYDTSVNIPAGETLNFNLYTSSNRAEGFTYSDVAKIKTITSANNWSDVVQQYGFLIPIDDLILNSLTVSVDKYLQAGFDEWIQITPEEYANMSTFSIGFKGIDPTYIESEDSNGFTAQGFANYVTGDHQFQLEPGNYICGMQFKTYSTNQGPFQIVFVPGLNSGFPNITSDLNYLNVNITDELESNTMYSYVVKGSLSFTSASEVNFDYFAFWPQNQCYIGTAFIGNQPYARTLTDVSNIPYPDQDEDVSITSNRPIPLINFRFYSEPQWVHPAT